MGKIYVGDANNIARQVNSIYVGDSNGIARKVLKGYVGDANGIAREFYSSFTPIIYPGTISFTDNLPAAQYRDVIHYLDNYFVITPSMIQEAAARGYTKVYLDYTAHWTENYSSSGWIFLCNQAGQSLGVTPSSGAAGTFATQEIGDVNLPNLYVTFPTNLNENLRILYTVKSDSRWASTCVSTVSNVRFGV